MKRRRGGVGLAPARAGWWRCGRAGVLALGIVAWLLRQFMRAAGLAG